jgi:hypothetical protein
MVASRAPVYVTQNGRVAAVLLSRDAYEGFLHGLAVETSATRGAADPSAPGETGSRTPAVVGGAEEGESPGRGVTLRNSSDSRSWLVETRFGRVDAETADFLAAEGYGLEPAANEGGAAANGARRR